MYAAPTPLDFSMDGTVTCLSAGTRGVKQTVAVMRRFVREYRKNLDLLHTARNLIFLTPAKDDLAEVTAIFDFVRDCIRYTRDIHDVETVSSPDKTLALRVGDCDDKSTLLATMLECVGYPTRFVCAAYNVPEQYEHVYVQVWAGNQWIDADATESGELGYFPPDPLTLLIEEV